MRSEFERAGVWGLMRRRIAAAEYTRPGDPMRIDCGYRAVRGTAGPGDARGMDGPGVGGPGVGGPGADGVGVDGIIRMFQAVSLEGDVEAAKGLAYTAPRLREGVARVEGAGLELTAVVEPLRAISGEELEEEATERYRFGVEAMEQQAIRVVTVLDLARAAQTARLELRV
jgi:hypothetical protein